MTQAEILTAIKLINPSTRLTKQVLSSIMTGKARFTAKDARAYRKAVGKIERRKEVYVKIRGIRHALSEFE